MCSASTVYRSLIEAELRAGDWACFLGGGGGVGIQGVQLAKAMGYRPLVVDSGSQKRKMALEVGAEAFVDRKEVENVAEEVIRVCDGVGAHAVFVTAVPAYRSSISLVGSRVGAKVMCIGLRKFGIVRSMEVPPTLTSRLAAANAVTIDADPFFAIFKNFGFKGTLVGSMDDTQRALDFARRVSHPASHRIQSDVIVNLNIRVS